MKKKCIPHIIAAATFVVFTVLFFSCVTISPEALGVKSRGVVIIVNTSTSTTYLVDRHWLCNSSKCVPYKASPGSRISAGCSKDEYEIRYTVYQDGANMFPSSEETKYWNKKTGYVAEGETVTVNIP